MANIEGQLTLNEIDLLEIDSDPSLTGLNSPVGTVALLGDQVKGKLWIKTGSSDLDWTLIPAFNPSLTGEPTGYPNLTDSVITFNNATRTLTVSPVGSYFDVYIASERIRVSAPISVQIPNVDGIYYFYVDASGTLQQTTSFSVSLVKDYAYTATVYWSSSQGKSLGLAEERHGLTMDWATQLYAHLTVGAWVKPTDFSIGNFTLGGLGTANSDAQVSIANGSLVDEDLIHVISHSPAPSANFQQILTPVANLPVMYLSGTAASLRLDTATTYPLKQGSLRPQYNLFSGGSWSTTDCTEGYYVASWVLAINCYDQPIRVLLGQREDLTLDSAKQNNTIKELSFGPVLISNEVKILYRLIYRVSSAYLNTPKAALVDIQDYRAGSDQGASSSLGQFSDHGQLSGLSDDDHSQYPLMAGRVGGQTIIGGINNSDNLVLRSTTAVTKGNILLADTGGNVGINLSSPVSALHIDKGNATASNIKFTAGTTTGQAIADGFDIGITTSGVAEIRQRENLDLIAYTNNTERLRIDSTGQSIFSANIRVGDGSNTTVGNIRFNGTEFLGREDSQWRNLTIVPIELTSGIGGLSTTSGTYSVITGLTTTPTVGTYLVFYSVSANITNNSNGDVAIFIDNNEQVEATRRLGVATGGFLASSDAAGCLSAMAIVTVNGSQVVSVRFRENGGGTLTVSNKIFLLIPIAR